MIETIPTIAVGLAIVFSNNPNLLHASTGSARELLPRDREELQLPLFDPWRAARPADISTESWSALGFRSDGTKLKLGRDHDLEWAKLTSKVSLVSPDSTFNIPLRRNGYEAEDSLKFPLIGSVFLTGKLGANSQSFEWQQYKVSQALGIGFRLPVGGEIQVRSGQSLTNFDSISNLLIPEQTTNFVELSSKWKLPWSLNLEYSGETGRLKAMNTHEFLSHDVSLAMPLSGSSKIKLGASYWWEDNSVSKPWLDRTTWYLGYELKR